MLFEIAPTDFCALATLLAGVAVLACLAPPCAARAWTRSLFCGMNDKTMRKTVLLWMADFADGQWTVRDRLGECRALHVGTSL